MTHDEAIEQLRRLAELAKKATPGPWMAVAADDEPDRWSVVTDTDREWYVAEIQNGAPGDTMDTERTNAELFAAAGSIDWPALLAAVEGTQ